MNFFIYHLFVVLHTISHSTVAAEHRNPQLESSDLGAGLEGGHVPVGQVLRDLHPAAAE